MILKQFPKLALLCIIFLIKCNKKNIQHYKMKKDHPVLFTGCNPNLKKFDNLINYLYAESTENISNKTTKNQWSSIINGILNKSDKNIHRKDYKNPRIPWEISGEILRFIVGTYCPICQYKNPLLKPMCPHANSLFTNKSQPFIPYHIINPGSNPLSIMLTFTPISLTRVICTTWDMRSGHKNHILRLYDTERKIFLRTLDKNYLPDNCKYCYSGDNKLLIAKTKTLRSWSRVEFRVIDINTGKCTTSFTVNNLGYLTCLTSTPKNRFVTGNLKRLVSLFSLNQKKLLKSSDVESHKIIEILANKDCKGGYLVSSISRNNPGGKIDFFDKDGNLLKTWDTKIKMEQMSYYTTGDILLISANMFQLLNFETGKCVAPYVSKNRLSLVTCLKDGNIIFYDWDSKKLKILDLVKNKIVQTIEGHFLEVKPLPQGGFIATLKMINNPKDLTYSNIA